MKTKKGFTLAETLITLSILGVIAVMVIPSLINRNIQIQHKTMIKKAMSVYDRTVANMVLMENIQNETQFKATDCEVLQKYFKPIETPSKCKFKTADKVWWDINTIYHPMIAFDQDDLTNDKAQATNTENKAFYLATSYDENARAFRSDDLQYEKSSGVYGADMEKLYAFLGMAQTISFEDKLNQLIAQYAVEKNHCICTGDNCCATSCPNQDCFQKDTACKKYNTSTYRGGIISFSHNPKENCNAFTVYQTNGNVKVFNIDDNQISMRNTLNTLGVTYKLNEDGTIYKQYDTEGYTTKINGITYDKNGEVISYYNYSHGTCSRTQCSWSPNPFSSPNPPKHPCDYPASTECSGIDHDFLFNVAMEKFASK